MIGLYLAALLFGGILISVSLFFGGHDGDAPGDHDHDHDGIADHAEVDHDHDGGADAIKGATEALKGATEAFKDAGEGVKGSSESIWLPFLSMRFWTFFAASFGLTGLILALFGMSDLASGTIAGVNGLVIGTAAAWFFKVLKRDQVSADTRLDRFVGQEARVLLPVRPNDIGKIAIQTMAGRIELPARSRDGKVLEPGQTVLIANVDHGTADVTGLPSGRPAVPQKDRE